MPPSYVVSLAHGPAERLAVEILTAQHESYDSIRFEKALTDAFSFLGFRAAHIGGAGRTDILLEAPVSAGRYNAVVDAKSNKNGKIADANIDWNSLADHREAEKADYILVVAPGFGGGNLLKRADDYGVTLLAAEHVVELVRLHHRAPFSLVELRALFSVPGIAGTAMDQLRQIAQSTISRWRLLRELIELFEQLPPSVHVDAQKLWLLLSFQHREGAPSLESVEDLVLILSSRAVGVLKPVNGSGEFAVTMQSETAVRRLRALTQALAPDDPPSAPVPAQVAHSGRRAERASPPHIGPPAQNRRSTQERADFDSARNDLVGELRAAGFEVVPSSTPRSLRLVRGGQTIGLSIRTSKLYPRGHWWWTFTAAADHQPLADCDRVVLVGLMQDPTNLARARREMVLLDWEDAVATFGKSKAWDESRRMHIDISPSHARWAEWVVDIREVAQRL